MNFKDTFFLQKLTLVCRGRLIDLSIPRVMGILNVTPDSFYDGGRFMDESAMAARIVDMLAQGADMIDVGACSSRPGAREVSQEEEKTRLKPALRFIRKEFPAACISVDTYRAAVAEYAVKEFGACLINDISAGRWDDEMLPLVGKLSVPYVMMHVQGTPGTMQINPTYQDVVREVIGFFAERTLAARQLGIADLIIDPGFGFGKTLSHNFQLLRELSLLRQLGLPIMVGLSRKSMVYKPLHGTPENALNGTTALNTLALANGANLLRVHDVREAAEAVQLFRAYSKPGE